MWIPFPTQTLMAAVVAIWVRVNLPLAVALVYISNPITIPPMFYSAYALGAYLLDEKVRPVKFALTTEWFRSTLELIWQPLLLGCLIIAILSSVLAYYGIQLFWRMHLWQRIKARREKHRQKKK